MLFSAEQAFLGRDEKRAPLKTPAWEASQMTVKSCVLQLFPVPQTGRSHIINILLASFFHPVL